MSSTKLATVWEAERATSEGFDTYESTTWNRSPLSRVVAGGNRVFSSTAWSGRLVGRMDYEGRLVDLGWYVVSWHLNISSCIPSTLSPCSGQAIICVQYHLSRCMNDDN